MPQTILRNSLETLFAELFEGPANPSETWIVSNEPDSGIMGTIRSLRVEQAKFVPDGLKHSIAEHVAHLHFALDNANSRLRGDTPADDWKSSWNAGDFNESGWQYMQRALRESQLRLRMTIHDRQEFDHFELTCGIAAALAHAAYHLGCIRQMAAIIQSYDQAPRSAAKGSSVSATQTNEESFTTSN